MTAWGLTWLWQGLALTLAAHVLVRAPRLNAATRYWIWWGALVAVAWLGLVSSPHGPSASMVTATAASEPSFAVYVPAFPDLILTLAVGVWLAVALVRLARLLPGVHAIYALRARCRRFPAEVEAQLPLWLEVRALGRATRLMLCDAVPGATVLGFHQICIALPPSLLSALTRDELDQVVLHEYAHVQRRDDWTRLAQALLQSALWIHPAVALIGSRLNLEREMACDEWVVARTGLPKAYARCLTRAAEVCGRIRVESVLRPALFGRRHDLIRRVDRLLATRGKTRRHVSALAAFTSACVLLALASHVRTLPIVVEIPWAVLPSIPALLPRLAGGLEVPSATDREPLAEQAASQGRARRRARQPLIVPEPAVTVAVRGDSRPQPVAPALRAEATVQPIADPILMRSRSFDGRYATDIVQATASPQGPWRTAGAIAGATGAEIGGAARKTSLEIANRFTRAGVSLARRF